MNRSHCPASRPILATTVAILPVMAIDAPAALNAAARIRYAETEMQFVGAGSQD